MTPHPAVSAVSVSTDVPASLALETEPTSLRLINAVATRRGVDPTALPPLYDWVEPEALDALFAPTHRGGRRVGEITFHYDGHDVVIAHEAETGVSIEIDGIPADGETTS